MSVYALKPRFQDLLRPLVASLPRIGVTANLVPIVAALGSIAAGGPNPAIDNLNSRIKAWWVMVALLALMGVFGGIVMSAIKRDRGVKDWGWMIEGHGGVLDRLDSVIFAAPVFFHLTRYWWT